jgi:hypothetical protein
MGLVIRSYFSEKVNKVKCTFIVKAKIILRWEPKVNRAEELKKAKIILRYYLQVN